MDNENILGSFNDFLLSSAGNEEIDKGKIMSAEFTKILSTELDFKEYVSNEKVLNKKPFKNNYDANWSISKPIRNFSFPKTKMSNKNYIIDFWTDFETGESSSLPVIGTGRSDSIKRIEPDVIINLLKTNKKFLIIDCRYDYEYKGGHIKNAVNLEYKSEYDIKRNCLDLKINHDRSIKNPVDLEYKSECEIKENCLDLKINHDFNKESIENFKLNKDKRIIKINEIFNEYKNHILIFYCEYSSIRAPRMANKIRDIDRKISNYPSLNFPEIYIIDGGYSKFYRTNKNYCEPENYVSMIKKPKKLKKILRK